MKPKSQPLAAIVALTAFIAAAFAGGKVFARPFRLQESQTRGVAAVRDTMAQVASDLKGHYFALIIGINNYQHLPKLVTPVPDAKALASVLHDQYGFETTTLLDSTHDQITKAMFEYRRSLDENASLLIYFAGHGIYDKDADKAYWLPVDAEPEDPSHWIGAESISTAAKVISARHVLIISDSCYSGGLTRDVEFSVTPQERQRYIEKEAAHKSRTLMSSGALEPVADGGGSGHSVFTGTLLNALLTYDEQIFVADDIFRNYVKEAVSGRSEQLPQYVPIRDSGHEYGDFVFVRVAAADAPRSAGIQPIPKPNRGANPPPSTAPAIATEIPRGRLSSSQTFGGIRFTVKSVNVSNSKTPVILVTATNTQEKAVKFKIYAPPNPVVIDNDGIASSDYAVEGVEVCKTGGNFGWCASPDPNHWSVADPGVPLSIALTFRGPLEFRGSRANVSFDVLLGAEREDGTLKPTLVPVVLPDVPLRAEASVRSALTSRSFGGINFDVMKVQVGDRAARVLVTATNMEQREVRFKIYAPPDPKLIDSNGVASNGYEVLGAEVCKTGGNFGWCAAPDPNHWSIAYPHLPLNFVMNLRSPLDFRGSSANLSFDVLLGTEKEDGTIKATLVPVVLPDVPIQQ